KKYELKTLLDSKIEGAKIRAKINIIDNEEKPSRYFFRKEKANEKKNSISELSVNVTKTQDPNLIRSEVYSYYQKLYSFDKIDLEACNFLLSKVKPIVNDSALLCEGPITELECFETIKAMANNKTPGSDGLPKEFYYLFFSLFGAGLVQVLNNAYE